MIKQVLLCFLIISSFMMKGQLLTAYVKVDSAINTEKCKLQISYKASANVIFFDSHEPFCPLDPEKPDSIINKCKQHDLVGLFNPNDFLIQNQDGNLRFYSTLIDRKRFVEEDLFSDLCVEPHGLSPVVLKTNEEYSYTIECYWNDLKISKEDKKIKFVFFLQSYSENIILETNWIEF